MPKKKRVQFGGMPPRYGFMLNPYPDQRISKCPFCEGKTGQRKIPLLIHIDPAILLAINYTNRYCRACDLLIAHKHEIEYLLCRMCQLRHLDVIGNNYLILGTVEKKIWKQGLTQDLGMDEILPHISDFKSQYEELRMTRPGWYSEDQEPPIMEPPLSQEWIKQKD